MQTKAVSDDSSRSTAADDEVQKPLNALYRICLLLLFLALLGTLIVIRANHGAEPHAHVAEAYSVAQAVGLLGLVLLLSALWFAVCVYKVRRQLANLRYPAGIPVAWQRIGSMLGWPKLPALLDEWVLVALSIIPAVLFVVAMRNSYNPAVFGMALVAIFVAAEHFGGLEEHRRELDDTHADLGKTRNALQDIMARHEDKLGRLLNTEGLERFRDDVYNGYLGAAQRIDAVVRVFDVDDAWWALRGDDIWRAYQVDPGKTLYRVLTTPRPGATSRSDAVQFVGHMPWPTDFAGSAAAPWDGRRADQFNQLFGLTWRLVVVGLVRETRRQGAEAVSPYVRVRLAYSAAWMHAVDEQIFQIVEGDKPEESTVRDLTRDIRDPARLARLSAWAHEDVRWCGKRGCNADEYVCTMLRWSALRNTQLKPDAVLGEKELSWILEGLGLLDWLHGETRHHPLQHDREHARRMCLAVFQAFVDQRLGDGVCAVKRQPMQNARLCDLLLETV